jgi:hypothetical protein
MAPQCPTYKPFVFSSYGNRVSKSAQFGRLVGWVISLSAWCPGAIRRGMPLPIGSLRADEHGPASGPGERWKRVGEKSCEGFASTGPARPNPGHPPCTEDEAMPDRIYGGSGLSYGFKLNTVPFPPILRSAWGHRRAQGEHRAIVRRSTGASAAVEHPAAAGGWATASAVKARVLRSPASWLQTRSRKEPPAPLLRLPRDRPSPVVPLAEPAPPRLSAGQRRQILHLPGWQ